MESAALLLAAANGEISLCFLVARFHTNTRPALSPEHVRKGEEKEEKERRKRAAM